jgi:hypothetical protein
MDFNDVMMLYPYLKDKNIEFSYAPADNRGYVEFYAPDEPGSKEFPRPKSLPMGKVGIEVLSKDTRPIDVLGDYVSHWGVYEDPFLRRSYQAFINSLDDGQLNRLQRQYNDSIKMYGERRPFSRWLESTGLPGYFRGYTFEQWDKPEELYRDDQLRLLDNVRGYLGITNDEYGDLGMSIKDSVDDYE